MVAVLVSLAWSGLLRQPTTTRTEKDAQGSSPPPGASLGDEGPQSVPLDRASSESDPPEEPVELNSQDAPDSLLSPHVARFCRALHLDGSTLERSRRVLDDLQDFQETNHVGIRRRIACHLLDRNASSEGPDLAGQYFRRYIDMAIHHKVVLLMHHISKSRGTTHCDLAWLNGCKSFSPPAKSHSSTPMPEELAHRPNCNSEWTTDYPLWGKPPFHIDPAERCRKRQRLASEFGVNFLANENFLDEDPCRGVLTFEYLRDPINRSLSHFRHLDMAHSLAECRTNEDPRNLSCARNYQRVFDNYMVRTLSGSVGYFKISGALNEEDLERAKDTVSRIDVLLVETNHAGVVPDQVIYQVGLGMHTFRGGSPSNQDAKHEPVPDAVQTLIRNNTQLDVELFTFARMLFFLDSLVYKAALERCKAAGSSEQAHCKAFLVTPVELPALRYGPKYGREFQARKDAGRGFSCGCGWIGAREQNSTVHPQYASAVGMPNFQACPRESLFQ